MERGAATELLLVRHAPALTAGCLAGRRDVPADCSDRARFAALCNALGRLDVVVASPALRCRQTAGALWPGRDIDEYMDALWEQDFGEWEGKPYADLPDLGDMPTRSLANHRPAGGESFTDLFHRAGPVLRDLGQRSGRIAVVAHAGVVRAALALALGDVASGLRFEVAPLSVTTLRALPKASWSVVSVNRTFP